MTERIIKRWWIIRWWRFKLAKWILPKGWHVHGDPVRKEKSIEPVEV